MAAETLERLQEMHRELVLMMGNINEMQKTLSQMSNELLEMDKAIQNKMDGE